MSPSPPRARWPRHAVMLGAGLCLALMVAAVNEVVRRPSDLLTQELSETQRGLFYRLTPGKPLRFSLHAGIQRVRVLSHLVVQPPSPPLAEPAFLYPLRLRQEAAGDAPVWESETHLRTRLSGAGAPHDTWYHPAGDTPREGVLLTDRRTWEVELPATSGASQLQLELPAAEGELWVAVQIAAEAEGPRLGPLRLSPQEVRRLARRITLTPWAALRPEDRLALVNERWSQLPAMEAEAGASSESRTVLATRSQEPSDGRTPLLIWKTRPLAVAIQGPAQLVLRLSSPEGQPVQGAFLTASLLGPEGPVPLSPEGATEQRLADAGRLLIPPGLHSLELHTEAEAPLAVLLTLPRDAPDAVWLPEPRRVPAFSAGPGCPPARLRVDSPGTRMMQVTARSFVSPQDSPPALVVDVTARNGEGHILATGQLRGHPPFAPFERAGRSLPHPFPLPCAISSNAPRARPPFLLEETLEVSEPVRFYVQVPPGAEQVTLQAPSSVLLSTSLFLPEPGAPRLAPPFEEEEARAPWHPAPLLLQQWHPLRPLNLAELELSTGAVWLEGQLRRVPRGDEPPGAAQSVEPLASSEQQLLLEPITDRASLAGGWEPGVYTLLSTQGPVALDFDASIPELPTVRYALPRGSLEGLGAPVELRQEDAAWKRFRLLTSSGREQLSPLPPGRHPVSVRTSAREARVLINRLPAPGEQAPLFRVRTVHALRGALTVAVSKVEARPVLVTALLYAPTPEALESVHVLLRVDGGVPRRKRGLLLAGFTPPVRELTLPAATGAAATFLQRTGQPPLHARPVGIVLSDELAPGRHSVTLEARGASALWARFIATPLPGQEEP